MRGWDVKSTGDLHRQLDGKAVRILPEPSYRSPAAPPPAPRRNAKSDLAAFLRVIQRLAGQHDWIGMYTYNPHGPDSGLHVILVREVVVHAEVTLDKASLTRSQRHWQEALQATGQVEVYTWTTEALPQIQARLQAPRAARQVS